MLGGAAGVHEGLGGHAQAGVDDVGLADVEDELGVLDQVNPEPEKINNISKTNLFRNDTYNFNIFEKYMKNYVRKQEATV